MERIPISREGHNKVLAELDELKKERPEVIQAIKEAREEGDLKENAGYHAARERQGWIEAKISHIESRLPLYDVYDLEDLESDRAIFGAKVELEDLDTEEVKVFRLLGPDDANPSEGSISVLSPVGRAIVGKEEGDVVDIEIPKGRVEYEILSISFGK